MNIKKSVQKEKQRTLINNLKILTSSVLQQAYIQTPHISKICLLSKKNISSRRRRIL